jgi:hypothetical protein
VRTAQSLVSSPVIINNAFQISNVGLINNCYGMVLVNNAQTTRSLLLTDKDALNHLAGRDSEYQKQVPVLIVQHTQRHSLMENHVTRTPAVTDNI